MTDPIQAAIAAAAAAAAQAQTQVATVAQTSTAVAVAAPAQTLSMESMSAGGMSVDKWFKFTYDGLKIGDSKIVMAPVVATIDMTENSGFMLKYAIKGGNPAQYAYTTDMSTAAGGGTWEAAQARIRQLAPGATPYRCVDLPFTLVADVVDITNAVVAKAGDTLGYTTSTTNWGNWAAFHKEVADAGLMGTTVKVKITNQPRENKNKNQWGVMAFELIVEE